MANETIQTAPGYSADGKTLFLYGTTKLYAFSYVGPHGTTLDDVTAVQTSIAKVRTDILAAIGSGTTLTSAAADGTALPASTGTGTNAAGSSSATATGSGTSTTLPPNSPGTMTGLLALAVGPTRAVREIADAIPLMAPGGVITVDDGTYLKPFHVTVANLTIQSASGNPFKCILDGRGGVGGGHDMAYHKGMLHSGLPITLLGLGFRNCGSPASGANYSNEAGAWFGDADVPNVPWTVVVKRCAFDNCANGVFSADDQYLVILIEECIYGFIAPNGMNAYATGSNVGPAHDNYLLAHSAEVRLCWFFGSVGHNVKARTDNLNVHDNHLMMQDGGRVVDCCEGGLLTFTGNTVFTRTDRQAQLIGTTTGRFGNSNLLAYANENTKHGTPGGTITGNVLNVSRTSSLVWVAAGVLTASGNTVHYYDSGSLAVQGRCDGLDTGSAVPGAPHAPPLPALPAWAIAA